MMALAVVDLPQPDSPTSPSVSPRATSKLTPDTACTVPAPQPERHVEVLDGQDDVVARPQGAGPLPAI